jgi:hypothetical protein
MLANFFDKSKPINFIVITGLFLLYFFLWTFNTIPTEDLSLNFLLKESVFLLLFIVLFSFFSFVNSKNRLSLDNTYAFLLFVTLFGVFPETFRDLNVLIFNIVAFLFLRKIYSFRTPTTVFSKLFDAGFWCGLLFILNSFSAVFFLLIYIGIYLYQKVTIRTVIIPILGFVVPVFLYFSYCFWFDEVADFNQLFYLYTSYDYGSFITGSLFLSLLFVGGVAFISFLIRTPKALAVRGEYRRNWFMKCANFSIALLFVFLLKERNGSEMMIVFFPTAIIIANWVESMEQNWSKNLLLITFIILPFVFAII